MRFTVIYTNRDQLDRCRPFDDYMLALRVALVASRKHRGVTVSIVVMVENIVRHLSHRRADSSVSARDIIFEASHEVQRPVFFAVSIIITEKVADLPLPDMIGQVTLCDGFFQSREGIAATRHFARI